MLTLNKTELDRRRRQLAAYRAVLPSLDLKRRQLAAEVQRARARLSALEAQWQRELDAAAEALPMAANTDIGLDDLLQVGSVDLDKELLLGVSLPRLREVAFEREGFAQLAMPHWVESLLARIEALVRLQLRARAEAARLRRLEQALARTVQRVNLFEKRLVPAAVRDIERIRVFLDDAARAGVMRAKIAKARHERARGRAQA